MRRFWTGTVIAALALSAATPAACATSTHQGVITELAKPEYGGRQAGTPGYAKAVDYLNGQMRDVGLQPPAGSAGFALPYTTSTALLTSETVSLRGAPLRLGVDYQPFARTPSRAVSTSSTFYVGDGSSADYNGQTPGLVVFHWNRADGSFGGGILDRILTAIGHGAQAVAVIADGELKVSNFEHPLNANTIAIPAIYISPAAADAAGLPMDHRPRQAADLPCSIDLKISRDSSAAASDLVGTIPGRSAGKAILWVTNIDGFGALPDGRTFASAVSGSAAAAMMLDMAARYRLRMPDSTQIFAFVGSKWSDQAGITALARKLDWSQIGAVIDLYAMGGTGTSSSINVMYVDPEFREPALAMSPRASQNSDLGNALSSVLSKYSKSVLMLRDNPTWIDDSLSDVPALITPEHYATGVDSLYAAGDALAMALRVSSAPPVFTSESPIAGAPAMAHTLTEHFSIWAPPSEQSLFTVDVLRTMESIYDNVAFYNNDIVPPGRVTAIFTTDGHLAAQVCNRTDLLNNPEAAGGGFATMTATNACIYQRRSGQAGEAIHFANIAHELNHAVTSAQASHRAAPGLQEWQGQSQFIRYNLAGQLPADSAALVAALYDGDVPNLRPVITDYAHAIDWAWFTANATNPNGWQVTYHIAGSMYAFIADQYGVHAARDAMERNYQNVSQYKANMVAGTGLQFDEFVKRWAYWMLNNGAVLVPVDPATRAWVDSVDSFYSTGRADGAQASAAIVQCPVLTDSYAGSAAVPGHASVLADGTMPINLDGTAAADVRISMVRVCRTSSAYQWELAFSSAKARSLAIFIPPNQMLALTPITVGANVLRIAVPRAPIQTASELVMNFFDSDTERALLMVDVPSLALAPQASEASPPPDTAPSATPNATPSASPLPAGAPAASQPGVSAKPAPAKRHTILCARAGKTKKVTAVVPKCPRGWKLRPGATR